MGNDFIEFVCLCFFLHVFRNVWDVYMVWFIQLFLNLSPWLLYIEFPAFGESTTLPLVHNSWEKSKPLVREGERGDLFLKNVVYITSNCMWFFSQLQRSAVLQFKVGRPDHYQIGSQFPVPAWLWAERERIWGWKVWNTEERFTDTKFFVSSFIHEKVHNI